MLTGASDLASPFFTPRVFLDGIKFTIVLQMCTRILQLLVYTKADTIKQSYLSNFQF